jgi:hypothetical protein
MVDIFGGMYNKRWDEPGLMILKSNGEYNLERRGRAPYEERPRGLSE